jgi:hypothetical protein
MKSTSLGLLQIFLWCVCAFHVIVGVAVNFSTDFIKLMATWYGARVDLTPQFLAIMHPLGAFMVILGFMAAVAALDPLRYRPIVNGFAALFFIRALQRVIFKQQLEGAFAIDAGKNTASMVFFFLLAASLFLLYRFAEKRSSAA